MVRESLYRKTWAEINLTAIGYNIGEMKKKLPSNTEIIAVVKADAYGHGSIHVAKKALEAGAKFLAVALLEEAIKLRKAAIKAPILVLGWVAPEYAEIAAEHDITLTFFQSEWLEQVEKLPLKKDVKLHMKWDTGMGRIGIRTEQELLSIIQVLNETKHVQLTGVFTHFATADSEDLTFFQEQVKRFEHFLDVFQKNWYKQVIIHIGNSAAAIRFPGKMYNYIRLGISMYGLYPSENVKSQNLISLKPAFSLHSRLVHVKKVSQGTTIGYGRTYTLDHDGWIGTLPIGYGDGWIRKLQGFHVLVHGKRMPIIGRICMDQMMVLLDREYKLGTKVTLIGKQNHDEITLDEVANYLDTINYEIPCIINNRVPRIYNG